jgi:hypothetical protein
MMRDQLVCCTSWEEAHSTHYMRSWVNFRRNLHAMKREKYFCTCHEFNPGYPTCNQLLHWQNYPYSFMSWLHPVKPKTCLLLNTFSVILRVWKLFPAYDMCELTLVGQAYLWHQVRCIMGVLLLIGQGKEKTEVMKQLLDIESHPA